MKLLLKFDTRNFSDEQREKIALGIKAAEDFKLPRLSAWNYENCRKHRHGWVETYYDEALELEQKRTVLDRPMPGCRDCAILFRQHQRVSVAWLYFKKRALLADTMGSGKTSSAGGLVAMLKETGELPELGRAVIIPRAPALRQWQREFARMMPGLNTAIATGTKQQRLKLYLQPWEVLFISPQTLVRDLQELQLRKYSLVLTDDIDMLRNPGNQATYAIHEMAKRADRFIEMTGTPVQKRLSELHSIFYPIGGAKAFGNLDSFERKYTRKETITEYAPSGKILGTKTVTGYRNLNDFKARISPMFLRRTAADLKDVELPAIQPTDHFLDLYPRQREKYKELQRDVLQIVKSTGVETKHMTALSKLTYGAQICAGLAALGEEDGPGTSSKMDWIIDKLREGGDLENEKVVVFAQYKNSIRALHNRFAEEGIGYATVWGENKNAAERQAAQDRFWDDPVCRVLIGTQSIEQSLNLQVARHLINMDMIMNPARMEQLAGRIRRDGSAFKHVFVHNLLTVDTQEERYLPVLEREAALAAHIWDESSELFSALDPMMMLRLIVG